jgi:hypothetical protein
VNRTDGLNKGIQVSKRKSDIPPSKRPHRVRTAEGWAFRDAMRTKSQDDRDWIYRLSDPQKKGLAELVDYLPCTLCGDEPAGGAMLLPAGDLGYALPACDRCQERAEQNDPLVKAILITKFELWGRDPEQFVGELFWNPEVMVAP